MVGTTGMADTAAVHDIQQRLYSGADRFVQADHARGAVIVDYGVLAALVAEILAAHTTAARTAHAAVKAVNAELRRELDAAEDTIAELRYDLDAAREGGRIGGVA